LYELKLIIRVLPLLTHFVSVATHKCTLASSQTGIQATEVCTARF